MAAPAVSAPKTAMPSIRDSNRRSPNRLENRQKPLTCDKKAFQFRMLPVSYVSLTQYSAITH